MWGSLCWSVLFGAAISLRRLRFKFSEDWPSASDWQLSLAADYRPMMGHTHPKLT